MSPFTYRDGAYRANWTAVELSAFLSVAESVVTILKGDVNNPMRQRLLPPASKNEKVAQEFQRLTGQHLVDYKVQSLTALAVLLSEALGDAQMANEIIELAIPVNEAKSTLQALTAIRLALGQRLEIEDDADSELLYHQVFAADDESGAAEGLPPNLLASIFVTAAFAQDTLVAAMQAQAAPPTDA